ncbi:MAG: type II toxin-antitoxin system HipA family toxin [Kiritimatiellae bacterium]|nr:type II toxin-antitoxin system HipA family toxin [Kiritimatiellia bacterium]
MNDALIVYYEDRKVGVLLPDDRRRMSFVYAPEWLEHAENFPISKSIPLTADTHTETGHAFFTNLLPEAGLREFVCRKLGISVDNDYELLKQIGGDCAGALRILPPGEPSTFNDLDYEKIQDFITAESLLALSNEHALEVRLSLAGAQYKLPVYLDKGVLYLPLKQAPSSHIMKFSNPQYRRLAEVEFLVTNLARTIGLNVIDLSLFPYGVNQLATISLRYDRYHDGNRLRRLHQEDCCQIMGIPGTMKYEQEGGPSLNRSLEAIRKYSDNVIADTKSFLNWMVFNVLVGNCDSHGKNLAFLYSQNKTLLAPHYDLVATINYPRVSTKLAMSIGGEYNVHNINKNCWIKQAECMGIRPQMLCGLVDKMSEQIISNIEKVFFSSAQVNPGFSDRLKVLITKHCHRIQRLAR